MNTRKVAIQGIIEFLQSDKKSFLITGTHQYEKHKLVLQTINQYVAAESTILFRINSLQNTGVIFENHTAKFNWRRL
jgi:hypothetical protein